MGQDGLDADVEFACNFVRVVALADEAENHQFSVAQAAGKVFLVCGRGLGKAVQFGPALWWLARVRPDLVRPRGRTTRRDLAVGAAFGVLVAAALFAVYAGRPFDLLGPAGHAALTAAASDKAAA